MKTLLKIIEELRKEAKHQQDSSMFWYDKFNELKQSNENIR